MIRFNNDYNRSCHPAILKALEDDFENSYPGYMTDERCQKAREEIKKYLGCPSAEIHFATGGTQANAMVIASALRPYESVVCAETGHINVHETGAVEHTGHKIEALPGARDKISAKELDAYVGKARSSEIAEHITQPGMVYISFPTEFGSIYSLAELKELRAVCDRYGMYLFVDGARLAYGLASPKCDVSLADLCALSDVFYIGGTKCGAMFGEAIVIRNDSLKKGFRNMIKQSGAMLAKGWILGIQFETLFRDGLYFEIGKMAVDYALKIKKAFNDKGIDSYIDSSTNQQFVTVTKEQAEMLARDFIYENEDELEDGRKVIRFCTSWATKEEDAQALIKAVDTL